MKKNKGNLIVTKNYTMYAALSCKVLIALFLFAGKTFAQSADEGASLGFKVGVNVTNNKIQEAGSSPAAGLNLGLFSTAPFSKYFAMQPELNLNMQKSHISIHNESGNTQFNVLQSYIEFALTGRVNYKKYYGQIGPYISYSCQYLLL